MSFSKIHSKFGHKLYWNEGSGMFFFSILVKNVRNIKYVAHQRDPNQWAPQKWITWARFIFRFSFKKNSVSRTIIAVKLFYKQSLSGHDLQM